jgi:general secretion pathway protein G
MKTSRIIAGSGRSQSGFTLLEIMLVVVIIGIIAGLAIMNLVGTSEKAKEDLARSQIKGPLKTSISLYQLHTGSWPSGLNDLLTRPGNVPNWRGPYVEEVPRDPWGEEYQYRAPGSRNPSGFDLWSKGPDKQDGSADDIGNWAAATQ